MNRAARISEHLPVAVLPIAPRRGLSCEEAAGYVGVSVTKFLEMVGDKRMPTPVRIDRRTIWDIRALDAAFDALREKQAPEGSPEIDGGWGDVSL